MPNTSAIASALASRAAADSRTNLGFPVDPPRWRAWCDRHGLLLIEDAAQAWLATWDGLPVGSFGDLAVFCLYKTFGVPDGAAALCPRAALPAPTSRPRSGLGQAVRRTGAWLAQRSPALSGLREGAADLTT